MTKKYCYLAGPIAGETKASANNWRKDIQDRLVTGIIGISPLRCEPLIGDKYELSYEDKRFGTASAIAGKNWLDVVSCDLILAYLPQISVGTVIEVAWGVALKKPIIIVSDVEGIVNHPLIRANVNWIFDNFDDALEVIHGLFEVYVDTKQIGVVPIANAYGLSIIQDEL